MEKYKQLLKKIIKSRFKKGNYVKIIEFYFVETGVKVVYLLSGELLTKTDYIFNSELNAYIYMKIYENI